MTTASTPRLVADCTSGGAEGAPSAPVTCAALGEKIKTKLVLLT